MNIKNETYDHFNLLKCVENDQILEIEKKFENFSVEPNYDYGINLLEDAQSLPKINIDLSKLIAFYKNHNYTVDDLNNEINIFNKYFSDITKSIDLTKYESIRQKSIIYYLYYFMIRCFFYVCMHNNFMATITTAKIFQIFFSNFLTIINSAKLCLENDILNSSLIIKKEKKKKKKIKKIVNNKLYESFNILRKYPNELNEFILSCHNFLSIILFSIDQYSMQDDIEVSHIDEDVYGLFQTFVQSFSLIHEINEFYSILDYAVFYNGSISKSWNMRRDFRIYVNNEKIRKRKRREEKRKQSIENNSNEKEKNKIDLSDELSQGEEDKEEKDKNKKDDKIEFTMFDHMWLFSTTAKNEIIRLFNTFKQKNVNRRHHNDLDFIFSKSNLTINIRREHLIEDALNELARNDQNLQNKLRVKFVGEQGVDQGGVSKEFFILVIRKIFDPNYGMFSYNQKTRLYWFNHYSFEPKIKYELIGTIFGLAIYNNTILDVKLPISVYKKLLGIKPSLEDLKECDNELYNNLNFILNQDNPKLEEELDTNFTVVDDKFGEKIIVPLKPDGENIMINNINKEEYVQLYIDWYFNKSIEEYFQSFEKGFYKIFHKSLIKILTPEELELIICGTQYLDFYELKRVCEYEDFEKDSETIKIFWEILLDFNQEEKKKFLSFVTGCDRAPIDGLGSLKITVTNGGNDLNQLPTSHTCFNNLILPDYKNKEKMKKALLTAINFSEGFGLI